MSENNHSTPDAKEAAPIFEDANLTASPRPAKATGISDREVRTWERHKDPEVTESDSDDDSFLGADFQPVELGIREPGRSTSPDALDSQELVKRRLKHVSELAALYKVEYWGLLEELRTRHQCFVQKQAQEGLNDPEGWQDSQKDTEEAETSLRAGLKRRRTESSGDAGLHSAPEIPPTAYSEAVPPRLERGTSRDPPNAVVGPGAASSGKAGGALIKNPFESFTTAPDGETGNGPLSVGDEMRGYGSSDDPTSFSDVEGYVLEKQGRGSAASKQAIQEWRAKYRRQLPTIERLEQAASASTARELDRLGALACLYGRHSRFLIKSNAVSLGRATEISQVDIDLAAEGDARKVSRHQAHLSLQTDGVFWLKNVGRRILLVNNRQVDQGQMALLSHLSLIEVGGVRLLFLANLAAVRRASARSRQLRG